jgi:hypothetical protein
MDLNAVKWFDVGQEITGTDVEAQGNRWLVYWLLGQDEAFCFMTDGSVYVEVINAHEWQELYADASAVTRDEVGACDLACERLKWLMQQRGQWKELV